MFLAASSIKVLPTGVDPVKEILRTRESANNVELNADALVVVMT